MTPSSNIGYVNFTKLLLDFKKVFLNYVDISVVHLLEQVDISNKLSYSLVTLAVKETVMHPNGIDRNPKRLMKHVFVHQEFVLLHFL